MPTHQSGKSNIKILAAFCVIVVGGLVLVLTLGSNTKNISSGGQTADISTSQTVPAQPLPSKALLSNGGYYIAQTFNNCGPAAFSMDLSFYGIHVSQEVLADILRPTHNVTGKGDDKSTPPDEIAAQAETYGLAAYFRPNGSIDLLKRLVAAGFPVMTRTLLNTSEDFAHYRVIKGYDDAKSEIIDEDGMQGENVALSYADFLALWRPFNYEYIVLAPPDKEAEVEGIIGSDSDANAAWRAAAKAAEQTLAANPNDVAAGLDLSVADYYLGDYQGSIAAFEAAEPSLSEHALWYQIEPIESYYELGDYGRVFSLAQNILS